MPGAENLPEITFKVETGIDDQAVFDYIAHALSLNLPDVQQGAPRAETLHIYANGPSATTAPHARPSMALNGAISLFDDKRAPTYWAACDAGQPVPDFLKRLSRIPDETVYLLASKVKPETFDLLNNRVVKTWHVADVGHAKIPSNRMCLPSAVSITISAIFLAHFMGYRKIITYGWDGCYINNQDHAVPQGHVQGQDITLETEDGQTFHTTRTWACEAQDAAQMLSMLYDLDLTIKGDGMFAHLLKPILEDMRQRNANSSQREA